MYRFNFADFDIPNEFVFQGSNSPSLNSLPFETTNNLTEDIPNEKMYFVRAKIGSGSLAPNVLPFGAEIPTDDNENEYDADQEVTKHVLGGFHPIEIGGILNERYKIIGEIARGGLSVVWQCQDLQSSDYVAVKIVESKYTKFAEHEITCLETIEDSHLFAKLLDYFDVMGANGTQMCLVFEMLGGTLLDLMDSGGIHLADVKTITKQMLQGLDYLHTECNLIHADIKMENILTCNKDSLTVKIADFGSARWADNHSDATLGTVEYRSPEMILLSGYGPSTDIWSLACTVFELATGSYLFYPNAGDSYTLEENHLALMIQVLGKVPKRIRSRGLDFFSSNKIVKMVNELKPCSLYKRLTEKYNWDMNLAIKFADFLLPMLDYNPDLRPTANECLSHEWFDS